MIIDIHSHIIPNVDDGSRGLNESMAMLMSYSSQGVTDIICTPHSWAIDEVGIDYVKKQFELLKRAAKLHRIPINLYLGCEMLIHRRTTLDCIEKLNDGTYPTLAGSRYVLTEFRKDAIDSSMCLRALRLTEEGYVPVIAHAERYYNMNLELAKTLKQYGAKIQVNLYSISGDEQNGQVVGMAHELLKERLVDFVGSDAHTLDHRPPHVEYPLWVLPLETTYDYAKKITEENPREVVDTNRH